MVVFDSVLIVVEAPVPGEVVVVEVVPLEVEPVPLADASELLEVLGAGAGVGVAVVVLVVDVDVLGVGAGVVTVVVLVSRVRSVHALSAAANTAAASATPSAFVLD